MLVYAQQAVQAAARHGARMGSVAQQCPACYAMSGARDAIAQAGILENTSVSVLAPGGSAGSTQRSKSAQCTQNFMAPLTSLFPDCQGRRLLSVPILHFGKKAGNMLWRDRRGYSMTFWAVFIGLVMIPAFGIGYELDGIFMPFQKWQRQQTLQQLPLPLRSISKFFKIPEVLFPLQEPGGNAQAYVTSNTASLSAKGVHAFVTGIQVSGGDNTVRVSVSADLSILFPTVVPKVLVTQTGVAKLRVFTH